jgi:1-acyl-sn-glycerol-3-phosphate acyltransferase
VKVLYGFAHSLFMVILKTLFHFRVYGRYNLPQGRAIVAANHQSYIDPPVVGTAIPEEIDYLAREDVFDFSPFRWVCARVNTIFIRKRQGDLSALKAVLKKLAQGRKVLVFPEGTRSYDGKLQPPEKGIGFLAYYSRAPVVPAYVSGSFEVFPRGGTMIRRHPISVFFGPPFRFEEQLLRGGSKRAYEKFSQRVMDAIAALKANAERCSSGEHSAPGPRPEC